MFEIDHGKFLAAYTREFGPPTTKARMGIDALLTLVDADTALTDIRWAAYLLATIKHETEDTWLPLDEPGKGAGRRYGEPVTVTDPQGRRYTHVYYGRGYVLLTWKYNYEAVGRALQNRLLYEPDLALEPGVAYAALSLSMRRGMITGRGLRHYITGDKADYVNARKIVNGLDQAERIAGYATRLEAILRESTPQPARFRVITPRLYLRAGPDMSQATVGDRLPEGTVLHEVANQGVWKHVALPGTGLQGWVMSSFLEPDSPSRR